MSIKTSYSNTAVKLKMITFNAKQEKHVSTCIAQPLHHYFAQDGDEANGFCCKPLHYRFSIVPFFIPGAIVVAHYTPFPPDKLVPG